VSIVTNKSAVYKNGSKSAMDIVGHFNGCVRHGTTVVIAKFLVAKTTNTGSLLGLDTAEKLGILRVGPQVNSVREDKVSMMHKYSEVFTGVGKLTDFQLELDIDDKVRPVAQPSRRIPYFVRKTVEQKLQELEDLDIIEPTEGPTPWVSPLVVIPKKNGEVRVCVDMRRANEAVLRSRHPIPTVDDIIQNFNGAVVFSKLDLKWGYHQVELHPSSRSITTFQTHKGLFRYKRLMFGISSAPEIYQHIVKQSLDGCKNVQNISDDIIVYGRDQREHDECLDKALARLRDRGMTLNADKCVFSVPELTFFGFRISGKGVAPDGEKVRAIQNFPALREPSEVRSFLGLVNYVARFIPDLATKAEPLRELTRRGTEWSWTDRQQTAFDALKADIVGEHTMRHYDPNKMTQLTVDASPVGLGAVLTQSSASGDIYPVSYASRSLSDVERRYSQTEKEALAVVWGCEKFHLFLYGIEFEIRTDHKALEVIYSPQGKPPARIERWALRMQPYRFRIKHIVGASNPADMLSRAPLEVQGDVSNDAEEYVNYIVAHAVPKAVTAQEILEATATDPVLTKVKRSLQTGEWSGPETRPYELVSQEMCLKNDIILRGNRIVLPERLWERTLALAHEGHQGIVKTKMLLRQKVWWPGIDAQVERLVKVCIPCQATGLKARPEPLLMTVMPEKPWQVVHIDLCGPFPTGEHVLGVVDECSRWPAVRLMKTVTTATVIEKLESVFATHGIPEVIVSDNGPQFVSGEFRAFCEIKGIRHRKVTPLWPAANAEIERFFRTLGKAVRTAHVEGRNWRREMFVFLLNYRSTPHSTTGVSPAEVLMNRQLRTKVPQYEGLNKPGQVLKEALQKDQTRKAGMKRYADRKFRAKTSDVGVGDWVLLRQRRQNKLSTNYDSKPYRVIRRKGSSVMLQRGGSELLRNVSFVKRLGVQPEKEREMGGYEPSDESVGQGREMDTSESESDETSESEEDVYEAVGEGRRPARRRRSPAYLRDYVRD
jgi:hypothetical protein